MKNLLSLILLFACSFSFGVATTLSVVTVNETSTALTDNAYDTTNGNRFTNPGCDTFLLLRNTHASEAGTVTVTAQGTTVNVHGIGVMTKANITASLAAGEVEIVGPLRCTGWNDSSGYVNLTAASGTIKISPYRLSTVF